MGIHFLTGFNQQQKFKWDSLILENKTDKIQSHEVFFCCCWYLQFGFSLSVDAVKITICVLKYNMLCNDGS